MTTNRQLLEEQVRVLQELAYRKASYNFRSFVPFIKKDYIFEWFHELIADKLNRFAMGEIKNLMILLPPQHGKSELASRLFPSFIMGIKPNAKLGLITYNDTFAKKFNRQIQRNIDQTEYRNIFPRTVLSGSVGVNAEHTNYTRNANEFEIVNHTGSVVTVGRDGQITGLPLDLIIIDDLYKNREEAISPTVSEKIWTNYNEVFKTRLHNGSQQLIMNTRWDEMDLAGRLLKSEPEQWDVIKLPAIKETDVCEYDHRGVGEALYPSRHSLERLLEAKKGNPITFNSLFQQDPKPNSELLIIRSDWQEIESIPFDKCQDIIWGVDWGWTNDPTVIVKIGLNLRERELYLDECFYKPIGKDGEYRNVLIDIFKTNNYISGQYVCGDRAPSEIDYLCANGVYCDGAKKPEGCIQARLAIINSFKIFITKRSINAKKEASNYQWITYGEIVTNSPLQNGYDHFWDAVGYPIFNKYYNI